MDLPKAAPDKMSSSTGPLEGLAIVPTLGCGALVPTNEKPVQRAKNPGFRTGIMTGGFKLV